MVSRLAAPEREPDGKFVNDWGYYTPITSGSYQAITPVTIAAVVKWTAPAGSQQWIPVKYEISWGNTYDARVAQPQWTGTEWELTPDPKSAPIWTDVTSQAANWDTNPSDGVEIAGVSKRSYGNASIDSPMNQIRARITFANGRVVESLAPSEPVVVILPQGGGLQIPQARACYPESWRLDGATFDQQFSGGGIRHETGPVTIGILMQIDYYDFDLSIPDLRYEVDWGDGGGWTDATAPLRALYDSSGTTGPLTQADLPWHTYQSPGTYVINGRVTYWDGAVLAFDTWKEMNWNPPNDDRLTVIVAPPAA